jgi:hypothetical protein
MGLFGSNDPRPPIRQRVREMRFQKPHELASRSRQMQEAARGGPMTRE